MKSTPLQDPSQSDELKAIDGEVTALLLENKRRFLAFLQKRTSSPQLAEEILQDAFLKAIEKGSQLRNDEGAVAWFYRLLRNALIDNYRKQGTTQKALETKTVEDALQRDGRDAELENAICQCIATLLPTLKDEYASVLKKVDLEEKKIAEVAKEAGLTPNTTSVRLRRARLALKKQLERSCGACATHGCLDCTCKAHG